MKRQWSPEELNLHWSLLPEEEPLLRNKTGTTRLGFAILLKFFQIEARFPASSREVPVVIVPFVAQQVGIPAAAWADYPWEGVTHRRHRSEIRKWAGFSEVTVKDTEELETWLLAEILPVEGREDRLRDAALDRCRVLRMDPPSPERLQRHLRAAIHAHERQFSEHLYKRLSASMIEQLKNLLQPSPSEEEWTAWQELRGNSGRAGVDSVKETASRLQRVRNLGLPADLFNGVAPSLLDRYARRAATEEPHALRRHADPLQMALLTSWLHRRSEELTDQLVDLLIEIIQKMTKRAEKKVEEELTGHLQKVPGKLGVLLQIAEASLDTPDGSVKEVIFPVASEELLRTLLSECRSSPASTARLILKRSYGAHYRRILPDLLECLEFRSTSLRQQPVMMALGVLTAHLTHKGPSYPEGLTVPLEGVVRPVWMALVVEGDPPKINRLAYEICVLKALREQLRCREIWVIGSCRYRDPEEDLPQDFTDRRDSYYAELGIPLDPKSFTAEIQAEMAAALTVLDEGMPTNPCVKILPKQGGWISVSPVEPQMEPENLAILKREVARRWSMISLLDILKETDLQVGFTQSFRSGTEREHLDRRVLQRRLLLCLYGLGTNSGLKRMAQAEDNHRDLLYVRRRFLSAEGLRHAIATVVNATLTVRLPQVWGEATTACASDSKQFGAWDQNLLTEWHMRYGGRGVMVYWHVEKKSTCIYSQFKRVSSSEAAAMIEGVLRHCTEMEVERQYVDSHGQTEVAFAFCRLLGFQLMPRLKAIYKQKLYRSDPDKSWQNLDLVMASRSINWSLIEQQLDTMVKHAVGLKRGMADAESLLRRFTRNNGQHPAYKGFAELGKAIKTIFLCRYLASEPLRREIHEGLNVVENWNSANGFIFYGKGGELASNKREDQEMGLLCLHLLQASLVYVNTLMIQQVLTDPNWPTLLRTRDLAALSPLVYHHINPYGRFELDLDTRIPFDNAGEEVILAT